MIRKLIQGVNDVCFQQLTPLTGRSSLLSDSVFQWLLLFLSETNPFWGDMFDHLAPYLLSATVRLLSWLSLRRAQQLGAWLGWLIWRMNARLAQTSRDNLSRCFPQLDESERESLCLRSLEETGKFGTESGMITCWEKTRWLALIRQVSGWEHFEAAAAAGRAVRQFR